MFEEHIFICCGNLVFISRQNQLARGLSASEPRCPWAWGTCDTLTPDLSNMKIITGGRFELQEPNKLWLGQGIRPCFTGVVLTLIDKSKNWLTVSVQYCFSRKA